MFFFQIFFGARIYCCAYQAWIAQVLDDSDTDAIGGLISDDGVANGRVLCQVANAIAPGAVEFIYQDESDTSNVSSTCVSLIANIMEVMRVVGYMSSYTRTPGHSTVPHGIRWIFTMGTHGNTLITHGIRCFFPMGSRGNDLGYPRNPPGYRETMWAPVGRSMQVPRLPWYRVGMSHADPTGFCGIPRHITGRRGKFRGSTAKNTAVMPSFIYRVASVKKGIRTTRYCTADVVGGLLTCTSDVYTFEWNHGPPLLATPFAH